MSPRSRLFAGAGLLLCALALCLLALRPIAVYEPAPPDRIDEDILEADVYFEVSPPYIWLPTGCFDVTWRLENIDSVWLNEDGRGGEESATVCGRSASFEVVFQNGETRLYDLSPDVRIPHPGSLALTLLLAVAIGWQGAFFLGWLAQPPEPAFRRVLGLLFAPGGERPGARLVSLLVLVGLFVVGAQHWLNFFAHGNVKLDTQDWRLTRSYWDTMAYAIDTRQLPYFTAEGIAHTEQFIGDPDPAWNPLLVFADRMTPAVFALINMLLVYAVGFVGLLLLRRRYGLSPVAFSILFLLFNFNGFITSHISVGHFTWVGYYGYPFLILFLLEMADGDESAALRAALKMGPVIAVMALFGSFHMIVWWGWALLLFGLFTPQRMKAVLLALAFAGLLCAYRYLPVVFAMSDYELDFRTGFPTLQFLLDGLTALRTFDYTYQLESAVDLRALTGLKWWEFDMYISLVGFAFVAIFGVGLRFVANERLRGLRYAQLDMPIALLTVFSMGVLYEPIFNMPLPFLNSERVTSRFFIIPLLLLLVVACIRFDRLLPDIARGLRSRLLLLALAWQMSSALGLHSRLWRIARLEADFGEIYGTLPHPPVIPWEAAALSTREWLYVLSLPVGIGLSALALVAWLVIYRRLSRQANAAGP